MTQQESDEGRDPDEDLEEKWKLSVSDKLDSLTLQHFFTVILSKNSKCEILEDLNVVGNETDHARFLSVAKSHTGDFCWHVQKPLPLLSNRQNLLLLFESDWDVI